MSASTTAPVPRAGRAWIVSPGWDLAYLVLTPLAIVPAVVLAVRHWLSPEQVYLAVISFASLGHHLPGFMRAYGDRELFARYRWRFLLAPPLVFALALLFTPPQWLARALGLPWTHLHGMELVLLIWGTWHGLMQTYGFMRIYDLRRGDNDRGAARLDHALCVAMFVAGVVFSDVRMFGVAGAMWQTGLPLFGPGALTTVRWIVGAACLAVAVAYAAHLVARRRRGLPINWVKLLLAASTGWFYWYCGRLSTNLLIGVAMFEIFHAVQYNAIVWIYNRRLLSRAGERFGPLGFLFRDRLTMLGLYLAAIGAYSSIRYFTAHAGDRMFSGDLADARQWLIALFVASSVLHFYYDGFIWKVSDRKTGDNLLDQPAAAPAPIHQSPAVVHAGKWAMLTALIGLLILSERHNRFGNASERQLAERRALAALAPAVPEAQMLASQEALARGEADTAVLLARQAAAARSDSHQAQAELAWALMATGDYRDAKTALNRAIALEPHNWAYHCDLGEAMAKLGDAKRAEQEYRRAIELAPAESEPPLRLGELLASAGRLGAARELLQSAIDKAPRSAAAHYQLALVHLVEGDAAQALPLLRTTTKLDPTHFRAQLQLGDALMALTQPAAAAEAYRAAMQLKPDVPDARVGLADAMLQLEQPAEAERILREGLARQPNSRELSYTLGVLLQANGNVGEAAWFLRRAQTLGDKHQNSANPDPSTPAEAAQ